MPVFSAKETVRKTALSQKQKSDDDRSDQLIVVRGMSAWKWRAVIGNSRTNADDRLPGTSLGRVESGDGVIEARDVADVCP